MLRFTFCLFSVFGFFGFFGCTAICQDPISPENLQICQNLAESLGVPFTPAPDLGVHGPGTPQVNCEVPEGFLPPANGGACNDEVDNDCDNEIDSFDSDCQTGVCNPLMGDRCAPLICDMRQMKCVAPPPPPARIDCLGGQWHDLCQGCPPQNDQQFCAVINGFAELLPDEDRDGIEDSADLCPWYNPGNSPCPQGDLDFDGDFVPDESDSCPFVFNPMDSEGARCAGHPEVNCHEVFPQFRAQMVVNDDFAWCEHFLPEVNVSVRFCPLDWFIQVSGIWPDLCLNCSGTLVPDGHICTLQNGWFPQTVVDSDGDGYPNEYPQSDGGFLSLDNCPIIANQDQLDTDLDGLGDACDP